VQNPPHRVGIGTIAYGDITEGFLVIQTFFKESEGEWECVHWGDRLADRQTLTGEYECYLAGSSTDYGSWSVNRIDTQ